MVRLRCEKGLVKGERFFEALRFLQKDSELKQSLGVAWRNPERCAEVFLGVREMREGFPCFREVKQGVRAASLQSESALERHQGFLRAG